METQSSSELQSWVMNTQTYLVLASRVATSQARTRPGLRVWPPRISSSELTTPNRASNTECLMRGPAAFIFIVILELNIDWCR